MDNHSIQLKYGRQRLKFQPLQDVEMQILQCRVEPPAASRDEIIQQALSRPMETPPLRRLAEGRRSAVILVSGKTRVTGSQYFLPHVMAELEAGGLSADQVTVVFATGTHESMTPQDISRVIGGALSVRVRVYGHDCHDRNRLVDIGTTGFDNRIQAARAVMEADLKILTGRITHHYFAGFTGGSKSILPGVCGFESIRHNHRMVMSSAGGTDPRATYGNLDDNPVHRDMVEAAELAQPDFIFNTILDHQHRFQHCVAGHHIAAHRAGCRLADAVHRRHIGRPAPLVVASCGGYPYDINFMQTIKTVFNCEKALAPGGTLILVAECPKGVKQGFWRWFAYPDFAGLDRAVLADYDLTGHNTYLVRRFLRQQRVIMVTSLPPDQVRQLGMTPARDLADALKIADVKAGSLMYVVPDGGTTLLSA
ncbi:MAG: nickel-dependent lactate racemase [Desulfobacterales bacterium]|nr:MAG: nickel-dependent lactate racemase [Desulfobacterales bacterium]